MPGECVILQCGGGEEQQCKPPDQAGIDEMDKQVNKMVIPDIKLVEMIIESKGEHSDRP
jgi:hypothetical protein